MTGGWPAYEEALKANKVTYTGYIYEGANHGFHNDTTPRYDEKAAKLAWQRTSGLTHCLLVKLLEPQIQQPEIDRRQRADHHPVFICGTCGTSAPRSPSLAYTSGFTSTAMCKMGNDSSALHG